ncbi:MAG: Glycosyl transferase family protein [Candidatus Woesebacteria bacterium GW2011_GWB1_45_5]|uniref:Glycosyl transferase family protein n=1 Tax=Candidatus Woesebacteria bacterium GW2011_GWB1_45_5 TaxID=1618581 RepID=A0A0G1QPI9_9BACT|nr:MAG: Glycosyl transferase family protein [Candidatus Woesebacteria bacterium GW2011_GWB1_45_5]
MIYLTLVLGFILRLISVNQSLWLDEATSALVAKMPIAGMFADFLPGDFHPPLYYLLLNAWGTVSGYSEVALRIPSLLAGMGTVYVVYRMAGRVPALLLATSGLHIYYSQEARMYALAALFVSLTVLFFIKTLHEKRVGDLVWYGIFLSLSILTDYLPVLVIPALWTAAWLNGKNIFWWKKFIASHIIPAVLGALWLPYFIKQITAGLLVKSASPAWWQLLGQVNFKNIILVPAKFIFGRIDMDVTAPYILITSLAFLLFGFLLVKSLKNFEKTKVIWLWLVFPLVLGLAVSFRVPTLSYFRYLFVLPAFYILVASGIKSRLFLVLVLVVNLLTSGMYLFDSRLHREDWRSAAGALGSSKVVFPADSQKEALIYYRKGSQIVSPGEATGKDKEIWLSRYVWEIFDPEDAAGKKIEDLGYNKTSEHNFNGVVFWKYAKKRWKE